MGTIIHMRTLGKTFMRLAAQRPWLQRLFVTTAAVTTAWLLGGAVNRSDGLVAAILAAVTLRVSLQASLSEGAIQLIGTAIGVGVAFITMGVVGNGAIAVALTTAASFTVAHMLRLGDGGVINIVITALIVLGPGMPTNTALDRTVGTAIGVAVALLFSYWAHPSTPVERTQELLASLSFDAAKLLTEVAKGLQTRYSSNQASDWLEQARALTNKVNDARYQAEEAVLYSRWSPIASKDEADAVFARFVAVDHLVVQVRNIARTVYDAGSNHSNIGQSVRNVTSSLLMSASSAVNSKAGVVTTDPFARVDPSIVRALRLEASDTLEAVQHGTSEELILGASILTAVDRIADSLWIDTPAIADVPTPLSSTTPLMQLRSAFARLFRRR